MRPLFALLRAVLLLTTGCNPGPDAPRSANATPLSTATPSTQTASATTKVTIWKPTPKTAFQVQYAGKLAATTAPVVDLDGVETTSAQVAQLKASGKKVICYFNAGGWENWRSDRGKFPASVIGKKLDSWPGERWLDIRKLSVLMPIMNARMDQCKAKGFDAVDPDNMDGYQAKTGFPLTKAHELAYFTALSKAAHQRGLAIGLKNGIELIPQAQPWADFAVNEECLVYQECNAYRPFIAAKKAVFHIEYDVSVAHMCAKSPAGFSNVLKHLKLDAWARYC